MIVTDEKTLKQKSLPITKEEAKEIFLMMEEELAALHAMGANPCGLAAIQIGIPVRAFIVEKYLMPSRFLNPKITDAYGSIYDGEMCLSFPKKTVTTKRFETVTVEDDINGKNTYSGLEAVIIQHEIDHLDGLIIKDREYHKSSVGRNDPCPCNSGKKYKKCCGK